MDSTLKMHSFYLYFKRSSVLYIFYNSSICASCNCLTGQRCDCTEHDLPKDRTISRLRGELHRLQEQMRKIEATKQPQKQPVKPSPPTIFVITPTYARLHYPSVLCSSFLHNFLHKNIILPPDFCFCAGWCRRPS